MNISSVCLGAQHLQYRRSLCPCNLLGAAAYLKTGLLQDIIQVEVLNRMCETRDVHNAAERCLLSLHTQVIEGHAFQQAKWTSSELYL